jgi:GH25 family lysozyme M1 (1,4-beta-N-acetylmuramidase)
MRSTRRTRHFVTTLAAGTALACGALTAGTAAAATPTPGDGLTHPDQDHAGGAAARHGQSARAAAAPDGIPGLDVSGWQGNVDWNTVKTKADYFADNGVFPGDQDVLNTDTYKKLLAQKR